jgi:hypothetical protein
MPYRIKKRLLIAEHFGCGCKPRYDIITYRILKCENRFINP